MGKNITLSVPDSLYAVMKEHPEVNWSTIARRAIEAFVKVLSKAEEANDKISKTYGSGVESRVSMGFGDNFNENRFPAQEGMYGFGYNAGINFNIVVQPTKRQPQGKSATELKEALKTATSEV